MAFSHGLYPKITQGIDKAEFTGWFINGVYTSIFCGPAAVIVFFLISGFCIHYPYKDNWGKFYSIPFLTSRLVRISGPIAVVSLIYPFLKIDIKSFYNLLGWSIVCEIFYYSFYPFLRSLIHTKNGWIKLYLYSTIPTFASFLIFPLNLVNYPGVGPIYVLFLGLPCWLLGAILVYEIKTDTTPSKKELYSYRFLIFSLAFSTHVLALQEIIGHPFTLNFFGLACFFWLKKEICYYYNNPGILFLEKAGKSSYSLYLIHGLTLQIANYIFHPSSIWANSQLVQWSILILTTYFFYISVEKPFHRLSRLLKRQLH